jgi:lysophospholipase L1-like esterase
MIRRAVVFATVLLVASSIGAAEPGEFIVRPGDRVLFLGDSITEQYEYSTYIELYLTTRIPNGKLSFYNAGIGGDTATGGARRFATHVLAEKPAVVTIDFGMNDGGYGGFDTKRAEQFVTNTEKMLHDAKEAGVRVALISPNAVEVRNVRPASREQFKTYLDTQEKFYAPLKELAAKYDVPFVDQYAVTRKVLKKIAADDAAVKPFPDGVHTKAAGGLLMAHTILTALRAPAMVSIAEIDAAKGESTGNRCVVKDMKSSAEHVTFERTDEAVPLPVLKEWRDLLPYVNKLADLNVYGLKVTGLKAGRYDVSIDGQTIGAYSADELANDVNLGLAEKGPLHDQGMKVLTAINDKNDIVHKRFRQVVMFDPRSVPDWVAAPAEVARKRTEQLAKMDEQIAARQREVYEVAKPATHHWEIKRAE